MIESFEILEVPTKIKFVIPECIYRESRIRKINVFWIPAPRLRGDRLRGNDNPLRI